MATIPLAVFKDLPEVSACNYSIFIVPFRYEMRRRGYSREPSAGYRADKLCGEEFDERYRYLTGETRAIMFPSRESPTCLFTPVSPRVSFYHLAYGPDDPSVITLRWWLPTVANERPGPQYWDLKSTVDLVLFEQTSAQATAPPHRCCGSVGLLMLRVNACSGMSMADLLDLNTHLRLLRYQHLGQRPQLDVRNRDRPLDRRAGVDVQRFPAFDVSLPSGSRSGEKTVPGHVDLWRQLLTFPIFVGRENARELEVDLDLYPDDRAFVACHACVDSVPWETERTSRLWALWHQLLHVEGSEGPPRGSLVSYEEDWVRKRTYFRWAQHPGDARLYGYSNYSFCCLCLPTGFQHPVRHFRTMYLDMLILLLYQRATVFAFGRELTALSQEWQSKGWNPTRKKFVELRESFDQFVNLYWFPVFTNQVQGLEMYEIGRRELDNLELFEEVRHEMEGTWGFMEASSAAALNRGALLVAVFAITLAFMGMSLLQPQTSGALLNARQRVQLVFPTFRVWFLLLAYLMALLGSLALLPSRRKRQLRWAVPSLVIALGSAGIAVWPILEPWLSGLRFFFTKLAANLFG